MAGEKKTGAYVFRAIASLAASLALSYMVWTTGSCALRAITGRVTGRSARIMAGNLSASVKFTGKKFIVKNNDNFDWNGTGLYINFFIGDETFDAWAGGANSQRGKIGSRGEYVCQTRQHEV